jgi:hypothetical protein
LAQDRNPLYLGGQFNLRILESGLSGQNSSASNVNNSSLGLNFSPYLLWEKPDGSARGVRLSIGYGDSERVSGLDETTSQRYSIGIGVFNRILLTKNTATLKFWLSPGIDLRYTQAKERRLYKCPIYRDSFALQLRCATPYLAPPIAIGERGFKRLTGKQNSQRSNWTVIKSAFLNKKQLVIQLYRRGNHTEWMRN